MEKEIQSNEVTEKTEVQSEEVTQVEPEQPKDNVDAKSIRKSTEERLSRKFEKEKQELEKSYQEQIDELKKQTSSIAEKLEQEEQEKVRLAQDIKLKEWGVSEENLDDMRKLTADAENEEQAKEIVSKYIVPKNPTTAPQKIQNDESKPLSLRDRAKNYYGF